MLSVSKRQPINPGGGDELGADRTEFPNVQPLCDLPLLHLGVLGDVATGIRGVGGEVGKVVLHSVAFGCHGRLGEQPSVRIVSCRTRDVFPGDLPSAARAHLAGATLEV